MFLVKKLGTTLFSRRPGHLLVTFLALFVITWCLLYLLLSAPAYTNRKEFQHYGGPCPAALNQRQSWDFTSILDTALLSSNPTPTPALDIHADAHAPIDCAAIMRGDEAAVALAEGYNWCQDSRPDDYLYTSIPTKGCDVFLQSYGYDISEPIKEEANFPIAFSILTYEDAHQTERLLQAIFKPHNVYCIHVDGKADSSMQEAIQKIAGCLPNVYTPDRSVNVHWAEYSVLEAELLCMDTLWKASSAWKYYINLTGREYPLKTNAELVQILQAYNGANDIDGSMYNRNRDWMSYVWKSEQWRTNTRKSPVPHSFNIHKGSAHVVATREFVGFALNDPRARDLREWMRDTRLPDEHFFNTLNHNPHMWVPGAYKGDPALKPFLARYKLWWQREDSPCSGQWERYVCQIGVGELSPLSTTPHLFVNKIHRQVSPVAYECLSQWHANRTRLWLGRGEREGERSELDLEYYRKLPFVNNHV